MKKSTKSNKINYSVPFLLLSMFIASCGGNKVSESSSNTTSIDEASSTSSLQSSKESEQVSSLESSMSSQEQSSNESSDSSSFSESSESESESPSESSEPSFPSESESSTPAPHEHTYDDYWDIIVEPTLTTTGKASRECLAKDYTQVIDIPALSDESVWERKVDKEATCKETGEERYISEYGLVYFTSPKKDHVYSDFKVSTVTLGGKATLVKECEVGHEILEEKQVTAPNQLIVSIGDDFTSLVDLVEITNDKNYPFVYDATAKSWTSSNKGKDDSKSSLSFTPKVPGIIEFDVVVSSESYDKFSCGGFSGGGDISRHCEFELSSAGNNYTISYAKDTSFSKGEDCAVITNLVFKASSIPEGYTPDYKIISFDSVGGTTVEQIVVAKNCYIDNITDSIPNKEGFVFDGWYLDNEYNMELDESQGLSDATTLYAKWAKLHTITLVKNNGTDNDELSIKDGDSATLTKPTLSGKIFKGWYTSPTFEEETKYEGDAIKEDTTLYAKWEELPEFVSDYVGVEIFSSTNINGNKNLSIDESGTLSGTKDGAIIDFSKYEGDKYIEYTLDGNTGTMLYVSDSENSYLVFSYGTSNNLSGSDFYLFVKKALSVKGVSNANSLVWDSTEKRIFVLNIDGKDVNFYIDGRNDIFYSNVSFKNDNEEEITFADIYKDSKYIDLFMICDENGKYITGYTTENQTLVELNDSRGTYTGSEYGTIKANGYNLLTIDGNTYSYESVDGNIYGVIDNKLVAFKVNKESNTYEIIKDKYEGTYTGTLGDMVLLGNGKGTLNGVDMIYYVVDGNVVLNGIDSYGLDVENKQYFSKSPFAGHTFTGTYYNSFDEENYKLTIVFNDTSTIEGILYAGYGTSYYFNFTGEFDSSTDTLTLTFGKCIDSSAKDKNIVLKLSGNTLTVVSTTISNGAYSFAKNGSATCEDFSL